LKNGIRAVILCPTRELAAQTTRECKKLAEGKKFYVKLMTKELARSADFSKLRCDILVSTPLRLEFAIRKRKLDLSRCVVCPLLNACVLKLETLRPWFNGYQLFLLSSF